MRDNTRSLNYGYKVIGKNLDRAVASLESAESKLREAVGFYENAMKKTENEVTSRSCELAIREIEKVLIILETIDLKAVDNSNE